MVSTENINHTQTVTRCKDLVSAENILYVSPPINTITIEKSYGKGGRPFFTVPIGIPFGVLGEKKPLVVDVFLTIVFIKYWRGTWTVSES